MGRRDRERKERIRAGIEIPISLKTRGVHVKLPQTERTVTEAVARNRRWERRHPEKTREDTRRRVQRYRERQKAGADV
jgi:Zn-finger nucleic acid-binding protein